MEIVLSQSQNFNSLTSSVSFDYFPDNSEQQKRQHIDEQQQNINFTYEERSPNDNTHKKPEDTFSRTKYEIQALIKSKLTSSNLHKEILQSSLAEQQQQQQPELEDDQVQNIAGYHKQSNIQNYQSALNQQQKLKMIEGMIGNLVKLKKKEQSQSAKYSSECSDRILEQTQFQQQQSYHLSEQQKQLDPDFVDSISRQNPYNHQNEQQVDFEEEQSILSVAKTIKEIMPDYPLSKTVCSLNTLVGFKNQNQKNTTENLKKSKTNSAKNIKSLAQSSKKQTSKSITKNKKDKNQVIISEQKYKLLQKPLKNSIPQPISTRNKDSSKTTIKNKLEHSLSQFSIESQKMKQKLSTRQETEKEIAQLFVNKGYGLGVIKDCSKKSLDGNKYNSLLTSVIRGATRKLCDIMTTNLNMQIKVFDANQQRLLRSPLVNCRKWLSKNEQYTFFKIIKIVYGMNQQPIYQDQVVTLYQKILRQLNKRSQYTHKEERKARIQSKNPQPPIELKPINSKFQNVSDPSLLKSTNITSQQKVVTHQKQNQPEISKQGQKSTIDSYKIEIAQLFAEFKSYQSAYLILTKRHPNLQCQKTELKAAIDKLIRVGLKKVLKYRKDYSVKGINMPSLNLSQQIVSQIINTQIGHQTRVEVVQCLLQNVLTYQRTQQLINIINSCLYELTKKQK